MNRREPIGNVIALGPANNQFARPSYEQPRKVPIEVVTKAPEPSDADVERLCLADVILNGDSVSTYMEIGVDERCFYNDAHNLVWRAIAALNVISFPITIESVASWLRDNDLVLPHAKSNIAYLVDLWEKTPATCDQVAIARRLVEFREVRNAVGWSKNFQARATLFKSSPKALLETAREEALSLAASVDSVLGAATDTGTLESEVDKVHTNIFAEDNRPPNGIARYGYRELDRICPAGFVEKNMVVVGARPGIGKTSFALNVAINLVHQVDDEYEHGVAFFSTEMARALLLQRLTCIYASHDYGQIVSNTIPLAHRIQYNRDTEIVSRLPIFVSDKRAPTIGDLRSFMYAKKRAWERSKSPLGKKRKLSLFLVDYLQNCTGEGKDVPEKVKFLSNRLADLAAAKDGVPILALSQLNRASEKGSRNQKEKRERPGATDLRAAGDIEQDAATIILLHKPWLDRDIVEALVEKNRFGQPFGIAPLAFRGQWQRFEEPQPDERSFWAASA